MARPVIVIGDGASGVLAALALARHGVGPVVVVGDGPCPGAGLAYRTTEPYHLLNSRACEMSALADVPDDLLRWCGSTDRPVHPAAFLPRRRYGGYLADRFRTISCTDRIAGRVVALRADRDAVEVRLADGRVLPGRAAVLAVGHGAPAVPRVPGLPACPDLVRDPWRPGAVRRAAAARSVLLIGTGLTAVDAALTVHRRHPDARIHAVSRHGLLPGTHPTEPVEPVWLSRLPATARGLLGVVRRAVAAGADWRGVVDGLRRDANRIWAALPAAERRRFVAHVDRYWQVHRHRMAPPVADAVATMRGSGALTVLAGRLARVAPVAGGVAVTLADGRRIHCAALVNCTGPGRWGTGTDPLAQSVRASGLARLDETATGLRCDARGRPESAVPVFALGPPRLGDLWETTAIPEIRAQADTVARAVADLPARRLAS